RRWLRSGDVAEQRSGLVDSRSGAVRPRASEASSLSMREAKPAELLIRGVRVLDPRAELDGPSDILIRDGQIAELGAPGSLPDPAGGELLDASGRHAFPAFVDPHVHLRTPGQEYKEDIASGTAA